MRLTASPDSGLDRSPPASGTRPLMRAAAILAGLAVVFALDRSTGSVPVQHLYYLPIILAALWTGFSGATVRQGNHKLVATIAACHGICRQLRRDQPSNCSDCFGSGEMTVGIVQGLQAIDIEHEHRELCSGVAAGDDERGKAAFERPQVVQACQIVGTRQQMEPSLVLDQPCGDQSHGHEERDLNEIPLFVFEGEQARVGEVIQGNRHE